MPDRRIDFIQLDSGEVLGDDKFCPEKVHLKSWYHWLSSCSYCFCYCDAPGPTSDRHFSLREVVSNITENRYAPSSILHTAVSIEVLSLIKTIGDIEDSILQYI